MAGLGAPKGMIFLDPHNKIITDYFTKKFEDPASKEVASQRFSEFDGEPGRHAAGRGACVCVGRCCVARRVQEARVRARGGGARPSGCSASRAHPTPALSLS